MPTGPPTFQIKAHVVAVNGVAPANSDSFEFWVAPLGNSGDGGNTSSKASTSGTADTAYITVTQSMIDSIFATQSAPNGYTAMFQSTPACLVFRPSAGYVVPHTDIAGTILVDETSAIYSFSARLYGRVMGLMAYRLTPSGTMPPDAAYATATPYVKHFAGFNQRYLDKITDLAGQAELALPTETYIADYVDPYDDDLGNWTTSLAILRRTGCNTMVHNGLRSIRVIAFNRSDIPKLARSIYTIPGYFADYYSAASGESPELPTSDGIATWAVKWRDELTNAGLTATRQPFMNVSDEPGIYQPSDLLAVNTGSAPMRDETTRLATLADFRGFLQAKGLVPADVGAADWTTVNPVGFSKQGGTLAERTLYYWSHFYFIFNSQRLIGNCATALRAYFPNMPAWVNSNHFYGRSWSPHSFQPTGPGGAYGPDDGVVGQDWHQLGATSGNCFTENLETAGYAWFTSNLATRQMGSVPKTGGQVGAYIHTMYTGGEIPGIQLRKGLALAGRGFHTIEHYRWGPEYVALDGSAEKYMKRPNQFLDRIALSAQCVRLDPIKKAGGAPPAPKVAIVAPRSAQLFDTGRGVQDAATNWITATVDYFAEALFLIKVLQDKGIQPDYIDEDVLADATALNAYKVLYLTTPNMPPGNTGSILSAWVSAGGTLVTFPGAGSRDYRNTAVSVVPGIGGLTESAYAVHNYLNNVFTLVGIGTVSGAAGTQVAIGVDATWRTVVGANGGTVVATFTDTGNPAIVDKAVGSGRRVHFAWWPSVAYMQSGVQANTTYQLPAANLWPDVIRTWVAAPIVSAGVVLPVEVNVPLVEVLPLFPPGATPWALTILNWNPAPVSVTVTVRGAFSGVSVRGRYGPVPVRWAGTVATVGPLTVDDAEVLVSTVESSTATLLVAA